VSRSFALLLLLSMQAVARTDASADDFSIILERTGCLGSCPDYTVTIHGDGTVLYEGRYDVRFVGTRKTTIPPSAVQKLIQRLREKDFFSWEEKDYVCLDFSQVGISVILNGRSKRVIEGCEQPGKVLNLADEIDRISGAKRWVGKVR
jgi:hypothetical protein